VKTSRPTGSSAPSAPWRSACAGSAGPPSGAYRTSDVATGLRKGQLTFTLEGRKLKGGWSLIRLRRRYWLLIKRRDRYASTRDITVAAPASVLTGRTLAQIAAAEGGDVAKAASGDLPRARQR
jgi:hypothetical protein